MKQSKTLIIKEMKKIVEYILGIGHLTIEECKEVFDEVRRRKSDLIKAQGTIQKEINVLNTIEFQVINRQAELRKDSEK